MFTHSIHHHSLENLSSWIVLTRYCCLNFCSLYIWYSSNSSSEHYEIFLKVRIRLCHHVWFFYTLYRLYRYRLNYIRWNGFMASAFSSAFSSSFPSVCTLNFGFGSMKILRCWRFRKQLNPDFLLQNIVGTTFFAKPPTFNLPNISLKAFYKMYKIHDTTVHG